MPRGSRSTTCWCSKSSNGGVTQKSPNASSIRAVVGFFDRIGLVATQETQAAGFCRIDSTDRRHRCTVDAFKQTSQKSHRILNNSIANKPLGGFRLPNFGSCSRVFCWEAPSPSTCSASMALLNAPSIGYGLVRAKQPAKVIRQVERELESIHHHLWHGDHELVCPWLGEMVDRIEATTSPDLLDRYSPLRSTLDKMIDLRNYLMGFQEEVVAYSMAHADKQPVSTAPVESLINRLVNHRMNKRQQMRWSIRGAHHVLQVRVALVNRTLAEIFSRWYPGFSMSRVVESATLQLA